MNLWIANPYFTGILDELTENGERAVRALVHYIITIMLYGFHQIILLISQIISHFLIYVFTGLDFSVHYTVPIQVLDLRSNL